METSNQAPTDINLNNITIDENEPINSTVGTFTSTDADTEESFSYSLVSGDGDSDNTLFIIDGNTLKTNTNFDFETKNSYSIRVRTTDKEGLSFEKQFTVNVNNVNEASFPIIKTPINDLILEINAANTTLDLLTHFDDPSTTGQVAQFELYNTSLAGGIINVLLFDQANTGAPLTVENFLTYVSAGDYTNTFIHRSVPGFIVQGGGFGVIDDPNSFQVYSVPQNPSVQNEFSPNRSSLRGTIAMAKLGGDPDSATNQWFFNLADNSDNLDNQNGGFTVFGQVLSSNDLAVIDAIASVPIYPFQSPFGSIPLDITDTSELDSPDDFIRFKSLTPLTLNELTFSVVSNSNPTLVNASINDNQLILDYLDDQSGTSEITIRGTSLLGYTVEDTFNIAVELNNIDPTNISLSNQNVAENSPIATTVGTLTTTDLDMGEMFTYSLVTGDGDTHNSLFIIDGDTLKTNAIFDYESQDTYSIRVQTTDSANNTYSESFTINIDDVNETPTDILLNNSTIDENEPLGSALGILTTTDPDTGENFTYSLVSGNGDLDNSLFIIDGDTLKTNAIFDYESQDTYSIRVQTTDSANNTYSESFTINIRDINETQTPTFQVIDLQLTASGFVAQFNQELDLTQLNLYDGNDASVDDPDLQLTDSNGNEINGSVVWNEEEKILTFVKTGGILDSGDYNLVMESRSDGFVNTSGELLDGDGDGNEGGDYVTSFNIDNNSARVLSLPDFARAPGQTVNIPAGETGIPITINNAEDIDSIEFNLVYDDDLLGLTGVNVAENLPNDWQVTSNLTQAGLATISLFGTTTLTSSDLTELIAVNAEVNNNAPYLASGLISIESISINNGAIAGVGDSAIQQVAFFGDASGNGGTSNRPYSGLDASYIARVGVGLDSGFDAYPLTDPTIVGDISGNGRLSGFDASKAARVGVGFDELEIPTLA